jgi:uncharacterized protein YbjT (DUF2867 family)
MTKILITGATGNVGTAVIQAVQKMKYQVHICAGVRNIETANAQFAHFKTHFVKFDFMDLTTYETALSGCQILFLLRPPQIADVDKYFKPLMGACQKMGVQHIIFLSVQGVENSSIIPHHKIEKLIVESKISYTFLRPAYFMQNFTTTLHHDLIEKKQVFLPAGEAKFTLIDVRDIGEVTARILADLTPHINKSYELTSEKALSFAEMTDIINSRLGTKITYKSPNLIHFFLTKKREHISTGFILVLIMLHYLPRFQSTPKITDWVEKITHQKPTTFEKFVDDNRQLLTL